VTTDGVTQMRELHASTNYVVQDPGRIAHYGVGDATIIDEVLLLKQLDYVSMVKVSGASTARIL